MPLGGVDTLHPNAGPYIMKSKNNEMTCVVYDIGSTHDES